MRLAKKGEKLLGLDGVERELHPEDVVVADARRALSIAGVLGGADSAIQVGKTKNVLLEAAWWDPVSIRRTARRHGLHTDASHRYERGADIEAIPEGLALAASLILERSGGDLAAGMIDEYPRPFAARRVRLRQSRVLALSGLSGLSVERSAGILERLGFGPTIEGSEIEASVPSWRPDVSLEEDLVEEVVRIHGYSKIPSELPPSERLSPLYLSDDPDEARALREIEELASDQAREAGLFEAMSFPFVAVDSEDALGGNLLAKETFRLSSSSRRESTRRVAAGAAPARPAGTAGGGFAQPSQRPPLDRPLRAGKGLGPRGRARRRPGGDREPAFRGGSRGRGSGRISGARRATFST